SNTGRSEFGVLRDLRRRDCEEAQAGGVRGTEEGSRGSRAQFHHAALRSTSRSCTALPSSAFTVGHRSPQRVDSIMRMAMLRRSHGMWICSHFVPLLKRTWLQEIQRHVTCLASISFLNVYRPTCLTFSKRP